MNSGHAQRSGVLKREAFVPGWSKGIQRLDTVGSTQEEAKNLPRAAPRKEQQSWPKRRPAGAGGWAANGIPLTAKESG